MTDGAFNAAPRPLRFAVLVDRRPINRWEKAALDAVTEGGAAILVHVVRRESASDGPSAARILRRLPYYLMRWLFARPSAWRPACEPESLGAPVVDATPVNVGGAWEDLPPDVVEYLSTLRLDFILRFGFGLLRGRILEVSRFGVWSHHHGDVAQYRGRPAGFWEMAHRRSIAGVTLQRLTTRLDGGSVLERGWFKVDPWSWSSTLDNMYWGSTGLVARHCERLLTGHAGAVAVENLGPIYSLPGWVDALRAAGTMLASTFRRLFYGLFLEKFWSVGVACRRLDAPPWVFGSVVWVKAPRGGALADPFIAHSGPEPLLFCEYLEHPHALGVLVGIRACSGGDVADCSRLLAPDRLHRSFPAVYDDGVARWMIPEQAEAGRLIAYRMSDDCSEVEESLVLMDGVEALDPVVFQAEGRVWLALTKRGRTAQSVLWLYSAESLRGPWTPHPANPIVTDVRRARSAGTPFVWQGRLIRPAQDCSVKYGGAVRLMQIDVLDVQAYSEHEVASLFPPGGVGADDGIHTLSVGTEWVAIDACSERFHWLAGVRRLQRMLTRRRVS